MRPLMESVCRWKKLWSKFLMEVTALVIVCGFMVSCGGDDSDIITGIEPEPVEESVKMEISWVDFIKLNGIMYQRIGDWGTDYSELVSLGDEYDEITFNVADNVHTGGYMPEDGHAAFHNPGTKVYEVEGYDPSFRLAIQSGSILEVYEVDKNPKATKGREILDIDGKVVKVTLNSEFDGRTVLHTFEDSEDVIRIVDYVLDGDIIPGDQWPKGERFFLEMHLADGTSVTRSYWIDDHYMAYELYLDEGLREIVRGLIDEGKSLTGAESHSEAEDDVDSEEVDSHGWTQGLDERIDGKLINPDIESELYSSLVNETETMCLVRVGLENGDIFALYEFDTESLVFLSVEEADSGGLVSMNDYLDYSGIHPFVWLSDEELLCQMLYFEPLSDGEERRFWEPWRTDIVVLNVDTLVMRNLTNVDRDGFYYSIQELNEDEGVIIAELWEEKLDEEGDYHYGLVENLVIDY